MLEAHQPRTTPKPVPNRFTWIARALQSTFAGHVSRATLLKRLLPLSFATHFGALGLAAMSFPTSFDWRVRVISELTDPEDNPRGYWLASVGVMAAMLVLLPFAGYLTQRLQAIEPRLARFSGTTFALAFGLTAISMVTQLAQPVIGLRWLHALLAGAGAGCFIVGMFCCTTGALHERRHRSAGLRTLSSALVWSWLSLTLLPVICLAVIGALMFLGHQAGLAWAENFRQSFRHTLLWNLAFWEWIGIGMGYGFMAISVLLLPTAGEAGKVPPGNPEAGRPGEAISHFRRD